MSEEWPRVLDWVLDPSDDRGIHVYDDAGNWSQTPYTKAALAARRVASAILDRGYAEGEVVAVAQRTGAEMIAALCGAMLAGATVCVLPTSLPMQREDDYAAQVGHITALAAPRLVICDADQVGPVDAALAGRGPAGLGLGGRCTAFDALTADARPAAGDALRVGRFPLLQFTSGSSGDQRGVRVSAAALNANHAGIKAVIQPVERDGIISWLPNHHDMGLIGLLLASLHGQYDGYFMTPQQFIREPFEYLRCISDRRVTQTAIPNFGLEYLCRRVSRRQTEELDLSSLRIMVGAERVEPEVLRRFEKKFTDAGLRAGAICPCYGSAEATLAVTISSADTPWRAVRPASGSADTPEVVSCGSPIPGTRVRILDEDGAELPEGQVGEIAVAGLSIAAGHLTAAPADGPVPTDVPAPADGPVPADVSATADSSVPGTLGSFRDGWLHTGDAGFLDAGELFVIGRLGDGMKVRGRMVFAENLEGRLVEQGLAAGACTVLLGQLDRPTAVFLFSSRDAAWDEYAARAVRELLGDVDAYAVDVAQGRLRKTSSGKPRRRQMWREFAAGGLDAPRRPLASVPSPSVNEKGNRA